MIVIGGVAAKYWGINRKDPKDADCFISEDEPVPTGGVKWDYHRLPHQLYSKIASYGGIAPPDILYTIKCSHLAWDVHWEKTKLDILYMKYKGCNLIPDIYKELKTLWEKEYGDKSFLSLKKEKEYFFDDHVTYIYDHDYLHELVAYPNSPVYLSVLKDGEQVLTDKHKFDKLPFEKQVRLFREEITVIACERWLLNKHNKETDSWYRAYQLSLKKTITRLTKGWATDFIIEHLDKFVVPDFSYFEHLLTTLEDYMSIKERIEEIKAKYAPEADLDSFVVDLAGNEFYLSGEKVEHPTGGDYKALRLLPEEEQKKYYDACREASKKAKDAFVEDTGYEFITQEGGGEGGTEYCYGVFQIDGKRYKAEWSYYSHQGYETYGAADSLREVKPVEKTITVWE